MVFEQMKNALVAAAADAGIEQYEIYYQVGESISAETLKDEISAFGSGMSGGVGFRCIINGKMGYASTSLIEKEELSELVLRARENAKAIENDDEVFIFRGSPSYGKICPGYTTISPAFKF